MANKVSENSQLICKYFEDAGIILHTIKQWRLRSRFTVFQLFLHRIYIGLNHAILQIQNGIMYHSKQLLTM